jgi:NAD+ kinase
MQIGLYGQSLKGKKFKVFQYLAQKLEDKGISWFYGPSVLDLDTKFSRANMVEDFDYLKTVDFVVTLGGDGTILQAMSLIGSACVPMVGINLGRLGFLASIDSEDVSRAIDALVEGKYKIRERRMLRLESNIPLFDPAPFALNDFTLHKRDTSSMITINTFVNGEFLTAYWADGLILSTPTGSTGYSLSCGGPIIMPNSGNFVITPVAPHNLNVRPIVLSDDSVISFEIEGRSNAFMCSMDSRFEVITQEHQLAIRKCDFPARLVNLLDYSYLGNIRKKLAWGVDSRN